jgi:cytochrome c-type biogenesis protein CcmH/NrfG
MEQEILNTLREIRGILFVLAAVMILVALVWAVNWGGNIVVNFKKAWENDFRDRANKYFESADFDRLVEHCEEKLKGCPNHTHATWWLARAKQEMGKGLEAKALFERLVELEPSWKETHIEPYLKKLSSE